VGAGAVPDMPARFPAGAAPHRRAPGQVFGAQQHLAFTVMHNPSLDLNRKHTLQQPAPVSLNQPGRPLIWRCCARLVAASSDPLATSLDPAGSAWSACPQCCPASSMICKTGKTESLLSRCSATCAEVPVPRTVSCVLRQVSSLSRLYQLRALSLNVENQIGRGTMTLIAKPNHAAKSWPDPTPNANLVPILSPTPNPKP